jgi:hypothetical protein
VILAKKSIGEVYFLSPVSGIEAGGNSTMTKFLELRRFKAMTTAGLAAIVLSIFAAPTPAAQEGRKGQIHVQKTCPMATFTGAPGSYCTITVSDLAEIPANGTRVYYDEPQAVPIGAVAFLDSKVVLYIGPGNWAAGRCTVDYSTGLGLCTVSDGIGTLAGFGARLNVRIDYATGITYWDGTYSFSPLPPR